MSQQKRSELLREYFGNALQLAYISEALSDWSETHMQLERNTRQLASVRDMRRRIRREKNARLHSGFSHALCA